MSYKTTMTTDIGPGGCVHVKKICVGEIHVTPRRVECKDCTYWNPDIVRNHRTELPKFWGIGMCEKSPDTRATGLKMACYEGHHDARLWPKRNILMRKF